MESLVLAGKAKAVFRLIEMMAKAEQLEGRIKKARRRLS